MEDEETTVPDQSVGSNGSVPPPSSAGMTLDGRPSVARQFAFTAAFGLALSGFAVFQWWIRRLATTPTGLVLTFFVTLAVLSVLWLTVLGFRTLDRRRLMKRFPGTLVFSFTSTSETVNRLREVNAFVAGRRDFDWGSVEAVADLRGLTFWQRNPPEMYGSLRWADIESVQRGGPTQTRRAWPEVTVDVHVRSGDQLIQISLFGVDASTLPVPTRREVEWVERQLEGLLNGSTVRSDKEAPDGPGS